jgi:hypothetical protein
MHPPNAPIVDAPLERKMNGEGFAIERRDGVLWGFESPGNSIAERNASARRFFLER